MLSLAVATDAETFERMRAPLADRDVSVVHVESDTRAFPLTGNQRTRDRPDVDVGFVYPPRLMEGGVVDVTLGVPWVNDRAAVFTSRNKAGVIATLDDAAVPVPDTVMVSNPVDRDVLAATFERFDPPVVIKPNSATRGAGVTKAADLDSFLGVCEYLDLVHDYPATDDRSFLVQEYLPDARDFRVMCVDGEYVGAVKRHHPDDGESANRWRHNVHRGAEATGVSLPDDLRTLAERAANTLDIPWLGVDLLVTEDRAVVSETNARPTIDDPAKYEPDFFDRLADCIRRTAAGST